MFLPIIATLQLAKGISLTGQKGTE